MAYLSLYLDLYCYMLFLCYLLFFHLVLVFLIVSINCWKTSNRHYLTLIIFWLLIFKYGNILITLLTTVQTLLEVCFMKKYFAIQLLLLLILTGLIVSNFLNIFTYEDTRYIFYAIILLNGLCAFFILYKQRNTKN